MYFLRNYTQRLHSLNKNQNLAENGLLIRDMLLAVLTKKKQLQTWQTPWETLTSLLLAVSLNTGSSRPRKLWDYGAGLVPDPILPHWLCMWSCGTSAGSGTVPVLPVLPLLTRSRREGAMDPSPLGIPRCQSWKPSLGKSSGGRAISGRDFWYSSASKWAKLQPYR